MKVLRTLNLDDLVFINIETAQLPYVEGTPLYESWLYKMRHEKEFIEEGKKTYHELFMEKGQYYPEFSQITSINIGKIKDGILKIKNFSGDEKQILADFNTTMNTIVGNNKNIKLCGHFVIGFTIPFLCTRSIVNQIEPCIAIDVANLKPWEVTAIDTQVLWKATSIRSASLLNIAVALGLEVPKNTQEELLTIANIVMKCRFENTITAEFAELKEKSVGILQKTFNTKTLTKEDEKKIVKGINKLNEKEKAIADQLLEIVTK
jgi:hypothetical protein